MAPVGDGGPATSAPPEHAERRRRSPRTATSTSRTCTINGCARSTRGRTSSRPWPAAALGPHRRRRARHRRARSPVPPASRSCPTTTGQVTLFIADYYNGLVRAVDARRHHPRRRATKGGSRSARRHASRSRRSRASLWVADSSQDRLVALSVRRARADAARAGRARAHGAGPQKRAGRMSDQNGSLPWMLSYLWPYRRRVLLLSVLLLVEIALGALQPWPLKIVIDNVLSRNPLPEPSRTWMDQVTGGNLARDAGHRRGRRRHPAGRSISSSPPMRHQVQVDTGQRMVYDLRGRLFEHLQALGLHHHITTSTGDAVYRVDVDAYAIENLVMSGLFPLATSIITLVVMFVDPAAARRHGRAAVAGDGAVPVSVPALLHAHARQPNREGSRSSSRGCSSASTKCFRRCGWSRASRASRTRSSATRASAETVMDARIAITWQESLFSVVVSTITILGTALVLDRRRQSGAAWADDARRAHGRHRVSRRRVRTAVVDRAHDRSTAGRAGRRAARARDLRDAAGDRRRAGCHRRDIGRRATSGSSTSASPIPTAPRCCTTSPSRRRPARWSRSSG